MILINVFLAFDLKKLICFKQIRTENIKKLNVHPMVKKKDMQIPHQ